MVLAAAAAAAEIEVVVVVVIATAVVVVALFVVVAILGICPYCYDAIDQLTKRTSSDENTKCCNTRKAFPKLKCNKSYVSRAADLVSFYIVII